MADFGEESLADHDGDGRYADELPAMLLPRTRLGPARLLDGKSDGTDGAGGSGGRAPPPQLKWCAAVLQVHCFV